MNQSLSFQEHCLIRVSDKDKGFTLFPVPVAVMNHTDKTFKHLDATFSNLIPKMIHVPTVSPNRVKQFYFQGKEISWDTVDKYFNVSFILIQTT